MREEVHFSVGKKACKPVYSLGSVLDPDDYLSHKTENYNPLNIIADIKGTVKI